MILVTQNLQAMEEIVVTAQRVSTGSSIGLSFFSALSPSDSKHPSHGGKKTWTQNKTKYPISKYPPKNPEPLTDAQMKYIMQQYYATHCQTCG